MLCSYVQTKSRERILDNNCVAPLAVAWKAGCLGISQVITGLGYFMCSRVLSLGDILIPC